MITEKAWILPLDNLYDLIEEHCTATSFKVSSGQLRHSWNSILQMSQANAERKSNSFILKTNEI